jgi:hypothetical protein
MRNAITENVSSQNGQEAARRANRWLPWFLLPALLLLSVALVAVPVFLIQPFRTQSEFALETSYFLRRWSPLATLIILVAAAALVMWQWTRAQRWWRKVLMVFVLLLLLPPVWFARQNHFEWMFNPITKSAYVKSAEASFVRDSDMVLAVQINDEAVAYPVRLMAYHHLVQDVVGGTPICATY